MEAGAVLVTFEAAHTTIVSDLLGIYVVCCFDGEAQIELGVLVGQGPEKLDGFCATLTKGVGMGVKANRCRR